MTGATKKRPRRGIFSEGALRHPSANWITSLEGFAACWEPHLGHQEKKITVLHGLHEAVIRKLKNIKEDFMFPWGDVEGIRSAGGILLSPASWRMGSGRRRRTGQLNDWLHEWHRFEGCGFRDLGCTYNRPQMLTWDRTQLTRRGKNIPDNNLAGLIARALSWSCYGSGGSSRGKPQICPRCLCEESSRKLMCSKAQLKCLDTSACSMRNEQQELENRVQFESYDLITITEMWWNGSHNWNSMIQGCKLFKRDR